MSLHESGLLNAMAGRTHQDDGSESRGKRQQVVFIWPIYLGKKGARVTWEAEKLLMPEIYSLVCLPGQESAFTAPAAEELLHSWKSK